QAVRALEPATGKLLWSIPFRDKLNESSITPVRSGEVLLVSSITTGGLGLRLQTKDNKPSATELWRNKELTCYFSTPVPVGKDPLSVIPAPPPPSFSPASTLRCVEARTGKELWSKPKVGKYHSALLRTADDKLLMLSDLGELILFEPDP